MKAKIMAARKNRGKGKGEKKEEEKGTDMDLSMGKKVIEQEAPKAATNGFMVFRREFGSKPEHSKAAGEAWKKLPDVEKNKYHEASLESRAGRQETKAVKEVEEPKKDKKKEVLFHTRCSVRAFTKLLKFVNSDKSLQDRVKAIGFGPLLKVEFHRLPHDLIVSMLRLYDPPTHKFMIRGMTREITADDMEKLLGIPHKGKEVNVDVSESDPTLRQLKREYGNKRYSTILQEIENDKGSEKFELLFVLYTLGTFLCPMSSSGVSDRLLRVICCTKDGFGGYDWATFMQNDLWKEMDDYVSTYQRKGEGDGICNVGGCLYVLLV